MSGLAENIIVATTPNHLETTNQWMFLLGH